VNFSAVNRGAALLHVALLAPLSAVALDWSGHVDVTGRSANVDGDRAKYRQILDLDDGVRLEEMVIRADREGTGRGPDRINIGLFGLGGDPYQRIDLEVRDYGRYQVGYQHRRSEYRYADILIRPEDASISGSTGGDFHRFARNRYSDRAEVAWTLNDRAEVSAVYDRLRLSGDSTTTLSEQREEFILDRPVDETLQSAELGIRYRWDEVTLSFTERYRDYDSNTRTWLPAPSQGSNPAALGSLLSYRLDQPSGFSGFEHVLQLDARPRLPGGRRMEVELQGIRSDLDSRHRAREVVSGRTFTGARLARDTSGQGRIDLDNQLIRLRARYPVTDAVQLVGGVGRRTQEQEGDTDWQGVPIRTDWALETTTLEAGLDVRLTSSLTGSAGWIGERREQRLRTEGGTGDDFDSRTRHNGYFAELSWRAMPKLDIGLSAERNRIDDPFTLTSATDRRRLSVTASYRWNDAWTVAASHREGKRRNDDSGWVYRDRHTELRLIHSGPRLTVSAGTARVDQDRDITQPVSNLLRIVIFDIDYASNARLHDAAFRFRFGDRFSAGMNAHWFRNRGSFDVTQDDVTGYLSFAPAAGYAMTLSYRNVDFEEGGIEAFDADLFELTLRRDW
jgi:hypothetical protein